MEILIAVIALLSSLLTFFSGFGLGTLLLLGFLLFFPVDIAITLTAVVHLLNNLFKFILIGKHTNKIISLKFGIPSIVGAFIGANLLVYLSKIHSIVQYRIGEKLLEITWIKLFIALLMILFALIEIVPRFQKIQFKDRLVFGGILSGFFGGLSGHQGALRSIFLIKAGLSKEQFIATGVIIACFVDIARLFVYGIQFSHTFIDEHLLLIAIATISAFIGAYIGNRLLKKTTLNFVQKLITVMIVMMALALVTGLI